MLYKLRPAIKNSTLSAAPLESLNIRDLNFSYYRDGQHENTLDGVSLKIKRGEKIAIVGYNDAGKTTLTKLVMRLYNAKEGEILYNGKNIKEYNIDSLRGRIAAVFQDYRISACSVAENVEGGTYDEMVEATVKDALQKSTFGNKLQSLPERLKTPLTREYENAGTQLSSGEHQKIAIARAFYKDANLIILDEHPVPLIRMLNTN